MATIRIPKSRQGQTGMGQGGWASYELSRTIAAPVTISLRSAIPLETDLDVVHTSEHCWQLVDPSSPEVVILEATQWQPEYAATEPVSIADAERARQNFPLSSAEHPAPHCISCGTGAQSLNVQAGPMGDGRWATPFHAPDWSLLDGDVDVGLLWMAMDCACGWYTQHSDTTRKGLTVQFAVDVYSTIEPKTDYALVAWHGDYAPGWEGRKRGAAAALFAADGECVAQSRSFWVAPK